MGKVGCVLIFFVLISMCVNAQLKRQIPSQQEKKSVGGTVCYHKPENQNLIIPPSQAYENWKLKSSAKTNTTTFEVTYIGFTPEAQTAFEKAVEIWSTLIESNTPIRITAAWQPLGANVLGGASPATYFRDFDGAQKILTWYPVALAEKMTGKELNDPEDEDIFAQFNSSFDNWAFNTDLSTQTGKTNFVTVVLHEIGHGLGITKAYDVSGENGIISGFFSDLHVVYDHFIETSAEVNLVQNFTPPSTPLKTELTSGSTGGLWFRTPQLSPANQRARLYAPSTFQSGSSIAHLDEAFYNGSENALMTPQVGNAEVIHNPGPVAMKMLADMGWVHTQIIHTQLPNTENVSTPYEVKAKFIADQNDQTGTTYGYNSTEVKLNYTTNGTSFTTVVMTPTGITNEFSATIPATGSAIAYGYYVSVKDHLNRTLTKPGIYTEDGKAPIQFTYFFEAGPDTKGPFFSHVPVAFVNASDTEFEVEAIVSDNIAVENVFVDFKFTKDGVTGSLQTLPMNLVMGTDSTYSQTISYDELGLSNGDKIEYMIRATDQANTPNTKSIPSGLPGFYNVNVVSLAPTQDSYINDFNTTSSDFFGDNLFSITTPTGFANGAIHTAHPYPVGTGAGFLSDFIYQLRIPIRLKETDATIKFDEIVLVEPGDEGSVFGDDDFWDYVIVEGSKDGGITWARMVDGYDSRAQSVWLTKFNSSTDTNTPPNSSAAGDPTLYRTRTINMLAQDNFIAGDEVVIRFRLNTDQLVVGWGWAIDNLKIQIDDVPPTLLHDHIDYLQPSTPTLPISLNVSDGSGIDKLFVEYKVNNGDLTTEELPVTDEINQYTLNITFGGLTVNDLIEYRIRTSDKAGNEGTLPATSFFQVPVITFASPVAQYIADFNSSNTDFVGNFFSVTQPSGFTNGAIHSAHPYPNGFGSTSNTSSYTYMLKKPITISATNPYMLFDEVALVEYAGNTVKDYVVVEGSKDNGATWQNFIAPYSALANSAWKSTYDAGSNGNSGLFRSRLINLTSSGQFSAGDNVIFRFRLFADSEKNGWGWALDNLSIQGPITGIEPELRGISLSVYPNPSTNGKLTVELYGNTVIDNAGIQIVNAQGRTITNDQISVSPETTKAEYSIDDWADGIYFLRLTLNDGTTLTRKFIKSTN